MRAVFPPGALEQVAGVIMARRRRALAPAGGVQAWREDAVQGDFRTPEATM
jgi:hypothetical protein